MKRIPFLFTLLFLAPAAFAAKFTNLKKLQNTDYEFIGRLTQEITSAEDIFGDCSKVQRFGVKSKRSEDALSIIRQLFYTKLGLKHVSDEEPSVASSPKTMYLVRDFFSQGKTRSFDTYSDKETYYSGISRLSESIDATILKVPTLSQNVFKAAHKGNDGDWSFLVLYDTKKEQILVLRSGFCEK